MKPTIPKAVLQGLKDLGVETAKEAGSEAGKILTTAIDPAELLGVKPVADNELAQMKRADQAQTSEELAKLRAEMGGGGSQVAGGRNVEQEIQQVIHEKEREEEDRERTEAQARQQQLMAQEQQGTIFDAPSSNPAKRKKARGSALAHGKKKSQPDPSQMSQTSEFSGKID